MSRRAEKRRQARKAGQEPRGKGGAGSKPRPAQWAPAPRVAILTVVFALGVGLLEVGLVLYLKSLGLNVRLSPHFLWMTPVAHLLLFSLAALLLLGLRGLWPRAGTRPVVLGVLAGLAGYSAVVAFEWLHPLAAPVVAAGVGVQAGRLASGSGRVRSFAGRMAAPAAGVLGAVVLVLMAFSFIAPRVAERRALAELGEAGEGRPNVLLIILDTVRASSTGVHNAALLNTPTLRALAADGVLFERAYAPSPWTLPAHATMFTGAWPEEHGADWTRLLDDQYPTVAEHLAKGGYFTAGFVGNVIWANRDFGLARGFVRYEDYPVSLGQILLSSSAGRELASLDAARAWLGLDHPLNEVTAATVTDRFLRWHEGRPDRPYFTFINYFDAHEPVDPAPGQPRIAPITHRTGLLSGELAQFSVPPGLTPDRFSEAYRAGYETTIAEVDAQIGRLLRELERRGDLENTIVVVTGDHGEMIGERGIFGHNNSLYLPTLWVPLIIRHSGSAPRGERVRAEASLRNLAATIADLTGLDEGAPFPGRSLTRHWDGGEVDGDAADSIYAHLTASGAVPPWTPAARGPEMHAVIRDGYQYILNGDGTEELYELDGDPQQTRNLVGASTHAPVLEALRQMLERMAADPVHAEGAAAAP